MRIPRPLKKPTTAVPETNPAPPAKGKRKIRPALHSTIGPRAAAKRPGESDLRFAPLTPSRWPDFVELFGPHGATGGCWCMWWRQTAKEFNARKGAPNKRAMKALVDSGRIPGILAYRDGRAVGWCSLAPREEFPRLERSRILERIDETRVWSVVCFFIARSERRRGVATGLLRAAVAHARKKGAKVVEGYPVEPRTGEFPDAFAFHGTASTFLAAGFREAARRSETRPIMRVRVRP